MHVMLNTCHIEKIFLPKGRITFLAFQLMQPISYTCLKMKTHYDTLEVSPQSTQDEIKASYYKLSKLYHPDINKSELAKRNFQNISEAYEVLSNHQARKRYDRSIMIKENVQMYNPEINYTYAPIYKSKTHPKRMVQFNFDLWTQKHYGRVLDRSKRVKMEYKSMEETLSEQNKRHNKAEVTLYKRLIIFSIFVTIAINIYGTYYVPYKDIKTEIKETKS